MRYKLTIEYDGTPYHGWQKQAGLPTVQGTLEEAFARFVCAPVAVNGSGRTDRGVHARGQVVHVDLPERPLDAILRGMNTLLLPHPIVITKVEPVSDEFDARFSATYREYLYRIVNRRARLAIDEHRVWHVAKPLDLQAMRAGAAHLMGKHDFTSFRSTDCQAKNPVRTLEKLEILSRGDANEQIMLRVGARSFLHNQVRIMTGTLVMVGMGRWQPEDVREALAARTRIAGGLTAPACGLYLMKIGYEPRG